jgi:hypothetical protein
VPENVLSRPEISVLLVLMVEATEISNPDLLERYGLTLTGKKRNNLNAMKLVDSRKEGRAYVHVLTDAGWARLAAEMRDGITVFPAGETYAAARAMLIGLRRFMARTDYRPADIFQPEDVPAASGTEPSIGPPVEPPAADHVPGGPIHGDVLEPGFTGPGAGTEARIRAAYAKLAPEPGAWVSLTRLRPLLGDAAKAEVDATLTRMIYLPEVNLVPESNQKTLTEHDREAGVTIGDQQKHLVSIGVR